MVITFKLGKGIALFEGVPDDKDVVGRYAKHHKSHNQMQRAQIGYHEHLSVDHESDWERKQDHRH